MRQKCPLTCCTTESRQSPSPVQLKMATTTTTVGAVACYDAASDKCPGLEVYCKRPSTAKTMRKKCAKTCGYCGETMEMTTTQMQPIIQLKIASQPCLNKSGDDFCAKYGKYCAAAKDSFWSYIDVLQGQLLYLSNQISRTDKVRTKNEETMQQAVRLLLVTYITLYILMMNTCFNSLLLAFLIKPSHSRPLISYQMTIT